MGQSSASDFLQNFGYITTLLWSPKFPGVRFFSDPQLLKSRFNNTVMSSVISEEMEILHRLFKTHIL